MPHDRPGKLRREGDERLRQDREETDRSLLAERACLDDMLRELEAALHRLGAENARVHESAVELDHGSDPLREETIRHAVSGSKFVPRAGERRSSRWGSARRIAEMTGRVTRVRKRLDEHLLKERAQVERLMTHAMALASTDALTDLVNSRVFTEVLSAQSELCLNGEQSFGVMYLDLDNFKRVNDLHGHVAGDLLLRKISNLIRRNVRREDVAARLGGDEFGILVSGLPKENVQSIGRRVIESIRALNVDYPGTDLGASLGLLYVDCTRAVHLSAEEILRRADAAMYEAKASGRKAVVITFPEED